MSNHSRFEAWVLPHLDTAYNYARWLTQDANGAEDVVQAACAQALKSVGSLNGGARAWFLSIVRRACLDRCRRNHPTRIGPDDNTMMAMAVDALGVDREQVGPSASNATALCDAVATLPLIHREVLILHELENLSYQEIARIAGVPIGSVISRLARARGLLQRSLSVHAAN